MNGDDDTEIARLREEVAMLKLENDGLRLELRRLRTVLALRSLRHQYDIDYLMEIEMDLDEVAHNFMNTAHGHKLSERQTRAEFIEQQQAKGLSYAAAMRELKANVEDRLQKSVRLTSLYQQFPASQYKQQKED
jgi:hypothetical protein